MKHIILLLLGIFLCGVAQALNLPSPPDIGVAGSSSDIWEYVKTAIKTIAGVILALLFVYFVFTAGGGLLQSLKQARYKGEWGSFFTYLGSMLVVAVVILFLVYFANDKFLKLL